MTCFCGHQGTARWGAQSTTNDIDVSKSNIRDLEMISALVAAAARRALAASTDL